MANCIVSANASSVTKTRKGLVDVSGTLLLLEERSAAKEEEEADWEYLREVKRRFLRPPLLLVLDVRGVDAIIGLLDDELLACILEMIVYTTSILFQWCCGQRTLILHIAELKRSVTFCCRIVACFSDYPIYLIILLPALSLPLSTLFSCLLTCCLWFRLWVRPI